MPRPVTAAKLHEIYERLLRHYGPQNWWPGESDLEMMVGAMLVQNTSWTNAARAIDDLKAANLLDVHRLHQSPDVELEVHLKSCGYFRMKTKRLKSLIAFLVERFAGEIDKLWQLELGPLRSELLAVHGVGPETADSMILYGARKPRFVVDKYTWRLLVRHGWLDPSAGYADMQRLFEKRLPPDVAMYNEYHALIVRVGSERCGAKPKCEGCPLKCLLPRGGPRAV